MQVQFNRPVTLGKHTYGKGQHAVPADEAKGWFWDALLKDGSAVVLREDAPATKEPIVAPASDLPVEKQQRKPRKKAE